MVSFEIVIEKVLSAVLLICMASVNRMAEAVANFVVESSVVGGVVGGLDVMLWAWKWIFSLY